MDIDNESVKRGLTYLAQVDKNIKEIRRLIAEASSNLDRRISNPYTNLKEYLRKFELRENDIVDLCDEFIENVEETSNEVKSVATPTSGEIATATVLTTIITSTSTGSASGSSPEVTTGDLSYQDTSVESQGDSSSFDNPDELNSTSNSSNPTSNPSNDSPSSDAELPVNGSDNNPNSNDEGSTNVPVVALPVDASNPSSSNDNSGNSSESPQLTTDSSDETRLLSEEQYEAIESFEAPTEEPFVDEEGSAEEYIKEMILSSEYLTDEDKQYICEQLDKGNIRSAIGRILVAQKRQEIEAKRREFESTEAYKTVVYYRESAESYKNAAAQYINGLQTAKGQMDLWRLAQEAERNLAQAESNPEYKRILANIEFLEEELTEYERSCKIWEYDYILNLVENESPDAARDKFLALADKTEDDASNPYMSPTASILLFQNAHYYRDLTVILSDEELLIYWYLRENESEAAAKEYLSLLEPKINSYYGLQIAEESFYNILDADAQGNFLGDLAADWEGIKIGTAEWFEVVANIWSKTGTMTKSEYAVLYINNMLGSVSYFIPLTKEDLEGLKNEGQMTNSTYADLVAKIDNGESISYLDVMYANGVINDQEYEAFKALGEDEKIKAFIERNNTESGFLGMNHLEWLKHFFNAGVTTGNMLPSVVASLMTYGYASGIGVAASTANTLSKAAGLATMFIYCLSSDKNAALREGRSELEAWIHGILNASSEVGTEIIFDKIFGFIPGLPDFGMMPSATKWKALGKITLRLFALAPLGEITEEMVQYAILDPLADMIAYGETDYKFKIEEALNIVLTTYISTFQLQIGSTVVSSPKIIKLSGALYQIDLGNGQKVNITYNDLVKCYDATTNEIDVKKLSDIISSKTGIVLNVDGEDIGLTLAEINSCRDADGKIDRSKIDDIIRKKLQLRKTGQVDVTNDYVQQHNFKLPNGCIVVFDSNSNNYLLLNEKGEVIRNLTQYEDIMTKTNTVDVTLMLQDTIPVGEKEYLLYDKEHKYLFLVDMDGNAQFLGVYDLQAQFTIAAIQENDNLSLSLREAIAKGSFVDGKMEIPGDVLEKNNIKLQGNEKLCLDEETGKIYRVDADGNIIAEVDIELLYEANLRDASIRLELKLNETTGEWEWVDKITGFLTLKNPRYIWTNLQNHLNGIWIGGRTRKVVGLHSFESFAQQLMDGKIAIDVNGEKITSPKSCDIDSSGNLVIETNDGRTIIIPPGSKGLISIWWEFTDHPRRGKASSLFPKGTDIQAIADSFAAEQDKIPAHLQVYEKDGVVHYNAYYKYLYTDPTTGQTIEVIIEVNDGEIVSMYPPDASFDESRPNTFDVLLKSDKTDVTITDTTEVEETVSESPNEEGPSVEQTIDALLDKYSGKGIIIKVNGDKCNVKVGDDSFEVPVTELNGESTIEKIDMLLNSDFFRVRNIYSNEIDHVDVINSEYHITTKHGDEIVIPKANIADQSTRTIMDGMTDFDYLTLRDMYSSSIESVTYDPINNLYVFKLVTGDVITADSLQLWNGQAENMIISATDPMVIDFKQRNQGKYISITYDGNHYTIVVNQYGDTISTYNLDNDVEQQLDMLNNQEYLILRSKFNGKFVSVNINDSNEYSIMIKGSQSRQSYFFTFTESQLGTQTLIDSIDMMLSDEYDNFYNNVVYLNHQALSIEVRDGQYIVTRLDGQQMIVEKGHLFGRNILDQLYVDGVLEKCMSGISSWSQNGDVYTIKTINGDVINVTARQMRELKIYNMILTVTTSQDYARIRSFFGDVIQSASINSEGNVVYNTIYGDTIVLTPTLIESENLFYDLVAYKYRHQATLMEDGRYKIIDRYGNEYILTESELADDSSLINIYNLMIEHENNLVNEWLINNIENMPGQITPQQQAAIDAKVDAIATRIGATRAEVYAAIKKGLKNIVATSSFANRVSMSTLNAILASWIKNQHETNESDGAKNPKARRRLENSLFYIPATLDARDAAVYGLLLPDLDTATDYDLAVSYYRDGPGYWYGRGTGDKTQVVIIYDKTKVMDNTTITIGDSLDYAYYNGGSIQSGSAAANPEFTGSFDGFLDSVSSLDEIENATLETFAPKYGGPGDQYIEIQVHGRYAHSVDVIQEVVFLVKPDPSITRVLDSMGIPWRVI